MRDRRRKRKPKTISKALAISRIDAMLPAILDNVRLAIQLEATLESGNDVVRETRSESSTDLRWYGANCYNVLMRSVTLTLALALSRLFDSGTKGRHINERDVASIPLMLRLAGQKRCRAVLSKRARSWTPGLGWAVEHENTVIREIDRAIASYRTMRRTASGRNAVAKLKNFRDKRLAHSLIDPMLKDLPRYEELSRLLRVASDVAAHLRLATLGENWSPDELRAEVTRQGEAFWRLAIPPSIAFETRNDGRV